MESYTNAEFWTEDRCISQRNAYLNVLLSPQLFPEADHASLWKEIENIEAHMLVTFATIKTARVLTERNT